LGRQPTVELRLHLAVEDDKLRASLLLGLVHGGVGIAQQSIGVGAARLRERDPDTGADDGVMAADTERGLQPGRYPPGDLRRNLETGPVRVIRLRHSLRDGEQRRRVEREACDGQGLIRDGLTPDLAGRRTTHDARRGEGRGEIVHRGGVVQQLGPTKRHHQGLRAVTRRQRHAPTGCRVPLVRMRWSHTGGIGRPTGRQERNLGLVLTSA
jgi:hypothetical protein